MANWETCNILDCPETHPDIICQLCEIWYPYGGAVCKHMFMRWLKESQEVQKLHRQHQDTEVNGGHMTTKSAEWVFALKPGDKVIKSYGWESNILEVGIVKKVTPSGIVRLKDGTSFRKSNRSYDVIGYGNYGGHILPVTNELLEQAQKQDKKRAEEEQQRQIINKALKTVDSIHFDRNITYEFASEFLTLFDRYMG